MDTLEERRKKLRQLQKSLSMNDKREMAIDRIERQRNQEKKQNNKAIFNWASFLACTHLIAMGLGYVWAYYHHVIMVQK